MDTRETHRAVPELSGWPALLSSWSADEHARRDREELGLPTDRPVMMTGHQPVFWHPGIYAKYSAAAALSASVGGATAWLVVDQDAVDPLSIELPVRDRADELIALTARLSDGNAIVGSPASSPPEEAHAPVIDGWYALDELPVRVRAMADALNANLDSPTLAKQAVRANFDLLSDHLPDSPHVYASELHGTSRFRELFDRMAADPADAVRAYNEAARAHPPAQIAPLRADEDEELFELPLWAISAEGSRKRVYAHELNSLDRSTLAPRALLATLIVRLGACDLFVHGTGGALYDTVTEAWARNWLGAELAPSVSITADVRLPIHERDASEEDLREARWRLHSARHNPSLLGDETAQRAKRALLEKIEHARESGEDPSPYFREMHENRLAFEFAHGSDFAELRERVDEFERLLGEAAIAHRRDWPTVLYGREQIERLDASIARALSVKPDVTDSPVGQASRLS